VNACNHIDDDDSDTSEDNLSSAKKQQVLKKAAESQLNQIRNQSFRQKMSILKSLENAPTGAKLMQMFQYKVESYKEY
jgi:hypothetical protein